MLNRDLEQDRQAVINDLVNATIILIVKKFNWSTKKAKNFLKTQLHMTIYFFGIIILNIQIPLFCCTCLILK